MKKRLRKKRLNYMRDFKIGIKNVTETFEETREILRQIDQGIFPERPIERVYFTDLKTVLRHVTPQRLVLLKNLHKCGPASMSTLTKQLEHSYSNVHDDVMTLESIGLIERDKHKRLLVPWNEMKAILKLIA